MLPTKFVVQPSESLKCPICGELFNDPVISTQCGHTFCRGCIRNGSSVNSNNSCSLSSCPIDRKVLLRSCLVSNLAVQGQIEDLNIYCCHGITRIDSEEDFDIDKTGCPEKIPLGKRAEHEDVCLFAFDPCPNSSNQCGKFRRRGLEDHLEVCTQYRCKHSGRGCELVGTKAVIEEHSENCAYKGNGDKTEVDYHHHSNEELKTTVKVLAERILWLEKNQDELVKQVEDSNSEISSLTETVEELHFQIDQLSLSLKRSSLYRDLSVSVSSIPETTNSTSPDDTMTHVQQRSLARIRTTHVAAHHDVWLMPCIFKCIGTLRGHRGAIWSLASKGHRLYSAGGDKVIKVWNMENVRQARCVELMEGHAGEIHTMCVGRGKLYSAGSDQTIMCWNLDSLTLHTKVENAHDNIICAIVYGGKFVFTSSHSCIKVWDASTLEELRVMTDLHNWVRALTLDDRREKLFSGSHNVVHIWDATASFDLRGTIDHTFGSVYSLAVTKQYIIVGTYNQNIHVYDATSYQYLKALIGHFGTVTDLVPSGSKLLFSASFDNTVQVWNLEVMIPIQTLSRHEASVNCVVIHRDLLLSGSEDTEIKVFKYFKME